MKLRDIAIICSKFHKENREHQIKSWIKVNGSDYKWHNLVYDWQSKEKETVHTVKQIALRSIIGNVRCYSFYGNIVKFDADTECSVMFQNKKLVSDADELERLWVATFNKC